MCNCKSIDTTGMVECGILPCHHPRYEYPDTIILYWASCGPCKETWSITNHPDWLTHKEAQREVSSEMFRHLDYCPIRRIPEETGFVRTVKDEGGVIK